MTDYEIPRADWVTDELAAERGEHAGFQMYSREGNDACAAMVLGVIRSAEQSEPSPSALRLMVAGRVRELAGAHPEVHDTEPEWAIVDALNSWLEGRGYGPLSRGDL
jgi:hypothetical protein